MVALRIHHNATLLGHYNTPIHTYVQRGDALLIEKWRLTNGLNDYATITDPEEHEDEVEQLIREGYTPLSIYEKNGRQEELFFK